MFHLNILVGTGARHDWSNEAAGHHGNITFGPFCEISGWKNKGRRIKNHEVKMTSWTVQIQQELFSDFKCVCSRVLQEAKARRGELDKIGTRNNKVICL